MSAGLQLAGLVAGYERGRRVLDGLALSLAPAQVHGLVGRNGAGKTTLLEVVAGYLRPQGGEARWNGRPLVRDDLAYLATRHAFYPRITGREYLRVVAQRAPTFDADGWARVLDLPLDHFTETYSTGMRRKLALLGVLALDRPLLLLDEPFNGLDVESNQVVARVARALADEGRTVLLTSHVLESLTSSCDVVHLLSDGRIAGSYAPADFARLERELLAGGAGERVALARALLARVGQGSGG